MNAICRPGKLEVAAWMRERRSAGCPPPDGAQIRRALCWAVVPADAPATGQPVGHDTATEAPAPIPERILP